MRIDFLAGHNFLAEVNGQSISLSYKGFGGKEAVMRMGEEGLSAAVTELQKALSGEYNPQAIQSFFQVFSCGNAIVLIEAVCPAEFQTYWTCLAKSLKSYGFGYSFAKTLGMASGTKDRLNHHQDNQYVQALTTICNDISLDSCPDDKSNTLIKQFDAFRDVSAEGISVSFQGAEANTYIYDVNGGEVVYCKRIRGDVSTSDILAVCLEVRDAIISRSELKPLTEMWGGSLVFRAMAAVCADDACLYFQEYAERLKESREKITGLEVLKRLNYDLKDAHNQAFINRILSILETMRNEQAPDLVDGNAAEIMKDDIWRLYYTEGKEARYCTIDFTLIQKPELRQELLFFMRSLFKAGKSNYTNAVIQISRYSYSLLPSLIFFDVQGISSLHDLTKSHLNALLSEYKNAKRSANYIAEALIFLRRMHRFLTYDDAYKTEAVFGEIGIPKREYSLKHVVPASDKTMQAVEESRGELQDCVELADLLLKALEARANDVFALPSDCVEYTLEGAPFISYIASKNGRPCKKLIPEWLANKIEEYAAETAGLRAELGMNLLLVYQAQQRTDSKRQPQVLSADKYNYHISKLLSKKGIEDIQGETATQTARQIRAAAGKKRFASGQTALQVAEALGNNPDTAMGHYRELDYQECASLRKSYNANDMKHLSQLRHPPAKANVAVNRIDYGTCSKGAPCKCFNVCSGCPSRIVKKEVNYDDKFTD